LYASDIASAEGQAHGHHVLWYCGLYGELIGWQALNMDRKQAKHIVNTQRDTIRSNVVRRIHEKCFSGSDNAAWAQADLCKLFLAMQLLDGGLGNLTLVQAERVLDIVLLARSKTNAVKSRELRSPRVTWIMNSIERALHDPPYDLRRRTFSNHARVLLEGAG
jgi:hypothetical protein